MNIFILGTGRCGTTTFIKASQHITNYSAAHESRSTLIGEPRLDYPEQHIEADNRLTWFLGRLDEKYGNAAIYVHLHRDTKATAHSFAKREHFGIMSAYREGILMGGQEGQSAYQVACDYIDTVEKNIECFLKDKQHKMQFSLESAQKDFEIFWKLIGAEGDIDKALAEWNITYNS